jgi:single-strand DNA-binding protein
MVRDPKSNTDRDGFTVTFPIASSRFYKGKGGLEKEVNYFTIETSGKLAERCQEIGHKGRSIRAVGRLRQDRWTDSDGKEREKIVLVAEHVEFRPEFAKSSASTEEVSEEPVEEIAEES